MEVFLALCVLIAIGFAFFFYKAARPVREWSDGELQQYIDANGTRRIRSMVDGMTDPVRRREHERLDHKYKEVELEWNRRQAKPKSVDIGDSHWLQSRKDFVATVAKDLSVSEQEAGRQIIEQRKITTLAFAGRTTSLSKKATDELVERIIRNHFSSESIKAESTKREFRKRAMELKSGFIAKGASVDNALDQAFAAMNLEAIASKEAEEKKNAQHGDADAQFEMGKKALQLDAALEWLNKAADQGHPEAAEKILEKSRMRPISEERRQALMTVLANSGNPLYQCMLADMFLKKGEAVHALKWLEKAVAKNDLGAMYRLGKMLEEGNGVEKDQAAALGYYRKSANQGHALAQLHLGTCYEKGVGVPQDLSLSYMWYTLAMRLGIPDAFRNFEVVIKKMSPEQIDKAKVLTAAWQKSTD